MSYRSSAVDSVRGWHAAGFVTSRAVYFWHFLGTVLADVPMFRCGVVAIDVPQVIEQLVEVTRSSSQGRILQSTREQILEVPVPQMVDHFGVVPEI